MRKLGAYWAWRSLCIMKNSRNSMLALRWMKVGVYLFYSSLWQVCERGIDLIMSGHSFDCVLKILWRVHCSLLRSHREPTYLQQGSITCSLCPCRDFEITGHGTMHNIIGSLIWFPGQGHARSYFSLRSNHSRLHLLYTCIFKIAIS